MKRVLKLMMVMALLVITGSAIAQPTSEAKRDRAYDRDLLGTREIIPYDHIREADVFWEKRVWRTIDFREKMNLPFTWPVDPFMQFVYDGIMNGELTAYSPLYDDFGEGTALTIEQLKVKYEGVDTTYTYNEETYEEEILLIPREFDYQNIKKIQIKEDWIFDEETSTLVVRIVGLAPIVERIDPFTGEPIGEEFMFWLYYPDLRNILVRHEVFNENNSARYITFDDIFEMRYFSSYIIKEDNVYDRFINSYAAGIDQVLESDRIKNEIFEFEHQLWEF